ncbi:MAG TPA: enoyl-CoA hydratase-related protein, partial [Candidatus Limnocylindrales bacterium]|nr:enoyl-CoA hydratase-related protein [Candidatus Limnocylindrales bacterium]
MTCRKDCAVLRLTSPDRTNKLGIATIARLLQAVEQLAAEAERGRIQSLIITGNEKFFSAGADLNEISRLGAAEAFEFS